MCHSLLNCQTNALAVLKAECCSAVLTYRLDKCGGGAISLHFSYAAAPAYHSTHQCFSFLGIIAALYVHGSSSGPCLIFSFQMIAHLFIESHFSILA